MANSNEIQREGKYGNLKYMSKVNEVKGQILRSKVNEQSPKIKIFSHNFCQKWSMAITFGE